MFLVQGMTWRGINQGYTGMAQLEDINPLNRSSKVVAMVERKHLCFPHQHRASKRSSMPTPLACLPKTCRGFAAWSPPGDCNVRCMQGMHKVVLVARECWTVGYRNIWDRNKGFCKIQTILSYQRRLLDATVTLRR